MPHGGATRQAIISNRSTQPKPKRRTEVQVCQISKSSGRRLMKRPGLQRFPCCRSSRPSSDGRREDEAEGHFADRPHHRQFPRQTDARAKDQRRARRTRQACDAPRGQHHQAAQHLCVDPAAEGRDQGVAEQGLRRAELSGQRRDAGGQGNPRPLRQGARQRRQSGAARGQFRPPRRRCREAVRAQASAQDGRLEQGLENARGDHVGRRFLRFGGRDDRCGADQRPDRAGRRQTATPRC